MFFEQLKQIPNIAQHTSCAIFFVPGSTPIKLKNCITIEPNLDTKTNIISVDQIRDLIAMSNNRETIDRFFIIKDAHNMNESAQNAFLKTFEEPKPHCHFVLLTEQPSMLLPTILSRGQIFFPKIKRPLDQAPEATERELTLAKKLIAAGPHELILLATDLSKAKTKPREQTLTIVATAIELLYKSYFKTGNSKFLTKISNFITLHDNLSQNGHLKLHLVADLL